jgi:hypothetical protein
MIIHLNKYTLYYNHFWWTKVMAQLTEDKPNNIYELPVYLVTRRTPYRLLFTVETNQTKLNVFSRPLAGNPSTIWPDLPTSLLGF